MAQKGRGIFMVYWVRTLMTRQANHVRGYQIGLGNAAPTAVAKHGRPVIMETAIEELDA